jgi:hypothetical protein
MSRMFSRMLKESVAVFAFVAVATLAVACSPSSGTDAGASDDAQSTGEAMTCGAGVPIDSGAGVSSDAQSTDSASCEGAVQAVIDVCGTDRKCEHLQYEKLCQSGNPAVVAGVFRCFGANMCWIPGDENTAGPCIDAAIHAVDPQADAFAARVCTLCVADGGTCQPLSSYSLAPWYLSQAQADAFRCCVASATTCAAATQCGADALSASGFVLNPTTC